MRQDSFGANAPAEYGGGGVDFIYDAIVMEELSRVRAHGLMMSLHSDICIPYITSFGNEEQRRRYLPGAVRGETILARIAMTEPAPVLIWAPRSHHGAPRRRPLRDQRLGRFLFPNGQIDLIS